MRIFFNPYQQRRVPQELNQGRINGQQPPEQAGDPEALQNVEQVQSQDEAGQQSTGTKSAPETPPEVAAFMRKIGLQPTNSKEGDNAAITARLDALEAMAIDPNQKSIVQGLRAEISSIISSVSSASSSSSPQSEFTGQDQLAALNKHFMLK